MIRSYRAFTLLELLVVIAIIAMLITLAVPEWGRIMDRARSTACMANLRQIGVAVGLYTGENEGKFPYINNPARPVYEDEDDLPEGATAMTMLEAFGPYGIAERTLRCPADVVANNYFKSEGSSYEWRPFIDGEPQLSPKFYTRRGTIAVRNPGRIRIVTDTDTTVHFGRANALFGDGRVQMR